MSGDAEVLSLRGVSKSYGSVQVLSNLDLTLRRGHVYGFLGRNGAGKSTTLRMVMGITRPDAGTLSLFGQQVTASQTQPRQRIGYVAQEQHFYEWMTPEQLGRFVGQFYPTWSDQTFRTLLRRLQLPARTTGTFSGGMKVKLALALALAHEPELLVLDEPTAGLDPVARREFVEMVREVVADGQRTLLFSSHLVDEVERISNRIGILEAGALRYEGAPGDLLARLRQLVLPTEDREATERLREVVQAAKLKVLSSHEGPRKGEILALADSAAQWATLGPQLSPATLSRVSLEDAFVALARSGTLVQGTLANEALPEAGLAAPILPSSQSEL